MDDNKIEIELDERLKHLSHAEIETLINRYYAGEKVKELIEEYKINISPSALYTIFPPQISDKTCPNCGLQMLIKRKSESASPYWLNAINEYCGRCDHKNNSYCNCEYCNKKRQEYALEQEKERNRIIQLKRELIQEEYDIGKYESVDIQKLSFTQKVYLGSLLRLALNEDMIIINPLGTIERNLAPTADFSSEIIIELADNKIIVVNPQSPIDAFVAEPEGSEFPKVYYIYKVSYFLNLNIHGSYHEEVSNLINPKELNEKDKDEALLLWKRIALEECLEYFSYQMNKVGFSFNPGDKTITVFEDLLEHFSVSQIYGIIYRSIANATKWYQELRVSKKHAANSVIGSCQRYGERAVIGKWELNKYNRITDCPQSMISEFFLNRVIEIGDLGFHMPPVSL